MSQTQNLSEAFTNCEREPIHLCGSIQPHGLLFGVNRASGIIQFISSNVPASVNLPEREILDHPLTEVVQLEKLKLSSYHYLSDGTDVYEVENTQQAEPGKNRQFKVELDTLAATAGLEPLYQALAESVRALTGFERVMVYKFNEDWSGTVVGESVDKDYDSFMDLRFPPEDIPAQARSLYARNSIRYIPDVMYESIPIASNDSSLLDLSNSLLRGVSKVHLEYLRNMNVGASMSVSVLVNGSLWGLVACHHRTRHSVSPDVRGFCESLRTIAAHLIETRSQSIEYKRDADKRLLQINLVTKLSLFNNIIEALLKSANQLIDLVTASGAAIVHGNKINRLGNVPDDETLAEIVQALQKTPADLNLYVTDSLQALSPHLNPLVAENCKNTVSGLLGVAFDQTRQSWLLWFRPELVAEVQWAGEPVKLTDLEQTTLHPRRSFSLWKETVLGKSHDWLPEDIRAAEAIGDYIRQRLESETRFEAAINAVNQTVLVVDQKSHIRAVNQAASKLFEELEKFEPGMPLEKLLPGGIKTKNIESTAETRKQKTIEASSSPLNTPEGVFSLVSISDTTEREELESERRRLTEALRDSNQKLEQFLDTIAHDLRSPLLAVSNLAQWIQDDSGSKLDEQSQENLAILRQRLGRMREQVTSLLTYSKLGNLRAQPERVDTTELIDEIIQSIPKLKNYNVIVKHLPTFSTVRPPLEHVLHNLLENAAKYGGAGGGDITVSYEDAGQFYRFSVQDNGQGIPGEYLNEVFLPLRSLNKSSSDGNGMGLAFVKRIVEQSGGQVFLESEVDKGSVFSFTWKKVWG